MKDFAWLILAWSCIGFGIFTLTEGYYAFRQRADRTKHPGRYWWVAGTIAAAGLALIVTGLKLDGVGRG
jgi:hypothetical protein